MASDSADDSLPPGTKPLSHQVAGHRRGSERARTGFLETSHGDILKPLQSPPRDGRELGFYEEVFDPSASDPIVLDIRKLLPCYLGLFVSPVTPDVRYLRLEDLTTPYQRPCIIDFKVGKRRYDPEATPEKIRREKSQNSSQEKIGFQIRGARVYCAKSQEYIWHRKEDLRGLDEDVILEKGIRIMYIDGDARLRSDVVRCVLDKLYLFDDWFSKQTRWAFYGSSLLVIYEGANRTNVRDCGRSGGLHVGDRRSPRADVDHVDGCSNGYAGGLIVEKDELYTNKFNTSPHSHCQATACHSIDSQCTCNGQYQDLGSCTVNHENCDRGTDSCPQMSHERADGNGHGASSDYEYPPCNHCHKCQKWTIAGPLLPTAAQQRPILGKYGNVYMANDPSATNPADVRHSNIPRNGSDNIPMADVRLIDFAHVFPSQSIDENFIYGLHKLIGYHEKLLTMGAT